MQSFIVASSQGDYFVEFHEGLAPLVARLAQLTHTVVVIDRIVAQKYEQELYPLSDKLPTLLVDATEEEKTLAGAGKVCAWLQRQNATKQTTLLVIGGGIVQDIVAFAAHIYYRGLRWVCVPTTLLGMSDSCIGAKCCINHGSFKNQLGAFHAPAQVHICTAFVDTLTDAAVASGYGEILKLMFTGSREHLAQLEQDINRDGLRNAHLADLIRTSLEIKRVIIEADEHEKNLRRILNYGHTFGHALEKLTEHQVPHGLAVAWGMNLVNYLAVCRGMLTVADYVHVHDLTRRHLNFLLPKPIGAAELLAAARRDKKVADGQVNLILPEAPGNLHIVKTPFDSRLEQQVAEYLDQHNVWTVAEQSRGRAAA